jgi:lipoprotein-releasing system ATP-binding protein
MDMPQKTNTAYNILELKNINMSFMSGDSRIKVLNDINLTIRNGESIGLVSPSGTGKTTLLQIAALLEKPTSGDVFINGECVNRLSDNAKTNLRMINIGFVYQFHNLLPEFSVLENVAIPAIIKGISKKESQNRALKLLSKVGLNHRIAHEPNRLSGGEQQRVAIARALINNPDIIIADEPTGNLDSRTAEVIFDLLINLAKSTRISIFMATHNVTLAARLDRRVSILNGTLIALD